MSNELFFTGGKNGVELSVLLDEGADLIDIDDEDEDPDAKLDPIYAIDLKKYLISFLRLFFLIYKDLFPL